MKVIHFIESFPDDIIFLIFHTRYSDLKKAKSTKQIEQSETRPLTTVKKCLKKTEIIVCFKLFNSCVF